MTSNVANRPNRQAKGFTKHYERREAKGRMTRANLEVGALIVRGTTDHLVRAKWLYFKKVQVEHPTDKGYFKTVFVLTDTGKKRLKTMKRLKETVYHFGNICTRNSGFLFFLFVPYKDINQTA